MANSTRASPRSKSPASSPTAARSRRGRTVRRGSRRQGRWTDVRGAGACGRRRGGDGRARAGELGRGDCVRARRQRAPCARVAAARLHPRQPRVIAAVTGTSGKTSVAAFTRQTGQRSAARRRASAHRPRHAESGNLRLAHDAGSDRACAHARSPRRGRHHASRDGGFLDGLDQHRIDGVRVTVGGFTETARATTWTIMRRRKPTSTRS